MARDIYHHHVRVALEKDGWIITDDPYKFEIADVRSEIDLGAEKLIAAVRDNMKIAVEIKSFLSKSKMTDWYAAFGQYAVYKRGLRRVDPNRKLYLAVEEDMFKTFFKKELIWEMIQEEALPILVFEPEQKIIISWIN